jgi:hypothetical protein
MFIDKRAQRSFNPSRESMTVARQIRDHRRRLATSTIDGSTSLRSALVLSASAFDRRVTRCAEIGE